MRNLLLKGVAAGAILAALAAAPARAADLPEAPIYVPPPEVYSWTGFYVGVHGGAAWVNHDDDHDDDDFFDFVDLDDDDDDDAEDPNGRHPWERDRPRRRPVEEDPVDFVNYNVWTGDQDDDDDEASWLFGAQIGYNWQWSGFVVGVEADIAWTDYEKESGFDYDIFDTAGATDTLVGTGTTLFKLESDWLATIRGRAGMAWDRWLIYVTGGAAVTNVEVKFEDFGEDELGPFEFFGEDDTTVWGWTIGVGVEGMITPNITAKLEYLYINFDEDDFEFDRADLDLGHNADIDAHLVRAGLNYKFNW